MPKLKAGHISPTAQENRVTTSRILADPDSRELDEEWFADAKPASELMRPELYDELVKRPRGRPKASQTKVFTAIRLDADLVDAFKATGKGWQTRLNAALRQYIAEHPLHP